MIARKYELPQTIHPHAQLVARRCKLPEMRLAYLDDPDEIEELAAIIVRHREHARRFRLRLYWSFFYGGTGSFLAAGLVFSVVFVAIAVLWLVVLVALGFIILTPAP